MRSLILSTTARGLLPLLLLFSVFLLMRGHYLPGGGFLGGLVATAGFTLHSIAAGISSSREALRISPLRLMSIGLLIALTSAVIGVLRGGEFFQAQWIGRAIPLLGYVGTPLLFDCGVYLVVLGGAMTIVFALRVGE